VDSGCGCGLVCWLWVQPMDSQPAPIGATTRASAYLHIRSPISNLHKEQGAYSMAIVASHHDSGSARTPLCQRSDADNQIAR
jgi:hypothetical protein